jgi:hypothetical protein
LPREIDPGVDRVRGAAVPFARQIEARVCAGDVQALDGLGLELEAVSDRQVDQVERHDHPLHRPVGRTVVDDHDLQWVVVRGE